jgi:type III secretion protein L
MKFLLLPHEGTVHPADGEKIIPKDIFGTLLSAEEVLAKAKQEGERHLAEKEQEGQALKEQAKQEGFSEGLDSFNQHLIYFDKQLRSIALELQKQILPLALKAAKKIVAEQLILKPDTIVDIVMQTLAPVLQNHRFTIYVNKADKEHLEANRPKIREVLEHVQSLMIQERADIAPGGCLIETESGIINATVENQWRALERAFEKYMKK